ncbi:MAG: PAS domain-containing protein [Chthoniobacterales bacterium]
MTRARDAKPGGKRGVQLVAPPSLAAAEVGTWIYEIEEDRVHADANMAGLFGVSESDAAGGPISAYLRAIHPDDLERVSNTIGEVVREGTTYVAEYRLVQKDGSLRTVVARGNVERDASGKAVRLPGVVLDISERVRAEVERGALSQELDRTEERMGFILESTGIGAWDLDLVEDKSWRSLQHDRIFGYETPVSDWNFETFLGHVLEEERAQVAAAFEDAVARSGEWNLECRIRRTDGAVRWIAPSGRVVRDPNDQPTRMYGTVVDITTRKEADEAIRESEVRFRKLTDTLPQMVWVTRADGFHEYYNQRWYEFTGVPHGSTDGEGWSGMFHPDDQERAWARWNESLATGEPYEVEYRLRHYTGEYRWTLGRALPIRNAQGEIERWYGTCTDIHERKQIEEALRSGREQLALALAAGELGTWTVDVPTQEMTASDDCRANFGRSPNEPFTYAMFWESIHPADRKQTEAAVRRAIERREDYASEYRTIWQDGTLHWIAARGRPVYAADGTALRLAGVTQNITARKVADEQREDLLNAERAARAEAERVGRMKDEFLATLSHELRTPLNAIFGWTQLMKSGLDDADEVAEAVNVIDRNVRVQTKLIDDLLDMNRIISGKLRLDVQNTELSESIEAAIETVKPAAEARGIRIEKILDPLAAPMSGDPARIQQIIWNLLSNAIKFTPKGGKVQVVLARVNSHIEISVADTGQGISAEFLPYVFDRFRQADASTNRKHGGLGLGLAIVKQLAELHGGNIRVASGGAGLGTTFRVSLPTKIVHHEEPETDRVHPAAQSGVRRHRKNALLQGLRVLVVDDEPDARELLRRMLEDCGAHVSSAASAAEAFAAAVAETPEVLVSDIGMAEVDGYELLKRLRAAGIGDRHKMPAIALTAFARSEDRSRALLEGFSAHLSKPVEPAELLATIAAVTGRTNQQF